MFRSHFEQHSLCHLAFYGGRPAGRNNKYSLSIVDIIRQMISATIFKWPFINHQIVLETAVFFVNFYACLRLVFPHSFALHLDFSTDRPHYTIDRASNFPPGRMRKIVQIKFLPIITNVPGA
ncbi:hypothetical protein T05_2559 [Trichinella murrelli]|uniref:Uncharacterized protein n=1 Tax=Trichinella murrelli TaxID=144512 RepID=A0A0V0TS08_9BILA|nr:hypothetical protein T05_2559 [Trichinella murrelli]